MAESAAESVIARSLCDEAVQSGQDEARDRNAPALRGERGWIPPKRPRSRAEKWPGHETQGTGRRRRPSHCSQHTAAAGVPSWRLKHFHSLHWAAPPWLGEAVCWGHLAPDRS